MAVSTVNHEAARAAASEKALLGALLLDARAAWPQVKDIVGRQHITRPDHGLIFGAIVDLITETGTADPVLVIDRLGAQLEAAGGRDYIADLYETCPSAANAGAYAKMMRQFADRAKVVDLAGKMQARARLGTSGSSTERDLAEQITELVKGRERQPLRKLERINYADMHLNLTANYVVKGLIRPSTIVTLNGASGCGKSFFALDLGCHIAAGLDWRGHRVRRGLVIYAALEGAISAQHRVIAWRRSHPECPPGIPLCLTPGPVNLRDPLDVSALIDLAREAEALHGEKSALVIIDTLSRAMAGGRENQPEDMSALIGGADALKNMTGAAIKLVHHLGKDESRGARGHSSLKGAVDTEIEITSDLGDRLATVTKDRDGGSLGSRFAFKLDVVSLGTDDEGDLITSCVALAIDTKPPHRKAPIGKNQAAVLAALQEWHRQHRLDVISDQEMRDLATAQGVNRHRYPEVIAGLQKFGWIAPTSTGFAILPESL